VQRQQTPAGRSAVLIGIWAIVALTSGRATADTAKPLSGYTVAVIEPVTVEKGGATKDFPVGLDLAIHDRTVSELQKKNLFVQVQSVEAAASTASGQSAGANASVPATAAPAATPADSGGVAGKTFAVSMDVISFDKGSTAARAIIGMGAGKSKIKIQYVLRDTVSGSELMRFEQTASWSGMSSFTGGDADDAALGAAANVVKQFIAEIAKDR